MPSILDTYIQDNLAEYKDVVTKFLKFKHWQKKVSMQQVVMVEREECPETPNPVKQSAFDGSVRRQGHFIGGPFTMLWDTWSRTAASSCHISEENPMTLMDPPTVRLG